MKKAMIALFLFTGLAFSQQANAQLSVNINIGNQPAWGPSGYNHADFYYIPSINVYYDVMRNQYVYMNGNRWIYGAQLPPSYRNFDLYRSYKVVVNRPNPFMQNRNDIAMYRRYRNNYSQPMNRDWNDYRNYGRGNNGNNHGYANNDNRNNGRGDRNDRGDRNNRNDHGNYGRGNGRH
jgi:hypothetical protein